MRLERKIAKDSWRLNLPAEQMEELGIKKGDNLVIISDKSNNRIILTPSEKASDVNLKTDKIDDREITDLIIDLAKENKIFYKLLKEKLPEVEEFLKENRKPISVRKLGSKNRKNTQQKPVELEYCYYCNTPLDPNRNHLKINGHKICHDCKEVEVQKFLLYLERRKLDAKEE